ncbi:MAG: CapA family protein [Lachnospiraceae bacterium]|nr:CapA family protein [Lachnospiraceae bacterium]
MSEIMIVGDLFPTESNEKLFEKGDIDQLFGKEIRELFGRCEYRIANLEGVLTESSEKISKRGPCIKASPGCMTAIKRMNIDCLSLANNHILDYGEKGLASTCKAIRDAGAAYVGVGDNMDEMKKVHRFEVDHMQIGVLSCAEYEFSIATKHHAGANPFDALEILDDIAALKESCDYVIVLYHGGKEYYRYPAPYVQKRCRKMAEKGADLVLCQHSHCIGCMEEYHGATIVYGQGNFLFDFGGNEFKNTGLMITANPRSKAIRFYPVLRKNNTVRIASETLSKKVLREFEKRSGEIKKEEFVAKRYEKLAQETLLSYKLLSLGKITKILRKLHMLKLLDKIYDRETKLAFMNMLNCEAHHDLYIEGLKQEL